MNLITFTIIISTISVIYGDTQNQGLTELNNDNFSKFILDQEHVLVMFHSPSCIHSLKLLPIISQVSKILTDKPTLTEVPVKIAIVDIKKETDLAYKFDIQDTPKLKFFRENNLVYSYDGPRDSAESILKFLKKEAVNNWVPPKLGLVDLFTIIEFDQWIKEQALTMINFYTFDCVHCERLNSAFEEAGKILQKDNLVRIARIDCTNDSILKTRYNLTGFPAIRIFRKGVASKYTGQADGKSIASFMLKSLNPSKEIKTFSDFKKQASNPIENFLVGVFNSQNDKLFKLFEQLTFKYPETFSFFYTFDSREFLNTIPLKGLKAPTIIVYYHDHVITPTESNFRLFNDENGELEALEDFLFRKSIPLIGVLTNKNLKDFYKNPRPICLALYTLDYKELLKTTLFYRDKLVTAAKKYSDIRFVICDDATNENLVKSLNVQEAKGDVSLVCYNKYSQRFIFDDDKPFEEALIDEFLEKFSKNKLKANYRSDIEPKVEPNQLIKTIVGSTIEEFLNDNESKDIVIYFFLFHGCKPCEDFEKLYISLATHFSNNTNVIFGKINIELNEFPPSFDVKTVPAMSIRRANTVDPISFDYSEKSNLKDLISFVEGPNKVPTESLKEKQEL